MWKWIGGIKSIFRSKKAVESSIGDQWFKVGDLFFTKDKELPQPPLHPNCEYVIGAREAERPEWLANICVARMGENGQIVVERPANGVIPFPVAEMVARINGELRRRRIVAGYNARMSDER